MNSSRLLRMKAWMQRSRIATGFFAIAVFGALSFTHAPHAFAQLSDNLDTVQTASGLADANLFTVIGTVISVFLGTLGVIALCIVLYSGWLWMTAGGDAKQIEKAKDTMVRALVGLVIVLSAYAITSFVMNMLSDAGLINGGGGGDGGTTILHSSEPHSGSLGDSVRDHYPARGATDVARNTRIFVTFRDAIDVSSLVDGYGTNGTPEDLTDDTVTTALNASNVKIYVTADGETAALASTDVTVGFTSDLKTFTFDPPVLGSATTDVNYTVFLSDAIRDVDGDTPLDSGGYAWTFTTGTALDLTPPHISSVEPVADRTYDRNISVQITFNEAVDPTSSTGETADGFANIAVNDSTGLTVDGSYAISNQYRTITFTSIDACGTNSCGETIYCLPGLDTVTATVLSATAGASPPQVDVFPYDGVVDTAGNTFDGDVGTETTYEDYDWSFSTTDEVNLSSPEIETIAPDIREEDVSLDQNVTITFGCEGSNDTASCDSVLLRSTISATNIVLTPTPEHDLWFTFSSENLDSSDQPVTTTTQIPAKTQITVNHGIFYESVPEGTTYGYKTIIGEGIRNEYQNCYNPGAGPNSTGGRCDSDTSTYCCNGVAQVTACTF